MMLYFFYLIVDRIFIIEAANITKADEVLKNRYNQNPLKSVCFSTKDPDIYYKETYEQDESYTDKKGNHIKKIVIKERYIQKHPKYSDALTNNDYIYCFGKYVPINIDQPAVLCLTDKTEQEKEWKRRKQFKTN